MPPPNSMNPQKGKQFQATAAKILSEYFNVIFDTEYEIEIGNPPKKHKFDLVSENRKYVGESKNYSWTEVGNIPAAKMAFMNEAVLYLQNVSSDLHRFIVMRKDMHPTKNESLAEYYYRTNRHLLGGVSILEIDLQTQSVRKF